MEETPFLNGKEKMSRSPRQSRRVSDLGGSRKFFQPTSFTIRASLILLLILVGLVFTFRHQIPSLTLDYTPSVYNSTLGFGAIILLSLPERTDRRDGISLIASTSGIQITKVIDATRGEDVAPKARPFGDAHISEAYLGSWRTHMDALKYVVDNRIETALLFEDDVDWDVRIKSQLEAFSSGLMHSPLRNKSSIPISPQWPYGNDWDIMHLGSVIIRSAPKPYNMIHARYIDPDRPKEPGCPDSIQENANEILFCWDPLMNTLGIPHDSRAILPSHTSIGLPAIAVTLEGAQRILFELSWNRLDNTLDWGIRSLLRRGRIRGWTVLPPLFGMFKVGDAADSDLFSHVEGEARSQIEGHSLGIERSARRALNDSIFGPASRQLSRWSRRYWEEFGDGIVPANT